LLALLFRIERRVTSKEKNDKKMVESKYRAVLSGSPSSSADDALLGFILMFDFEYEDSSNQKRFANLFG